MPERERDGYLVRTSDRWFSVDHGEHDTSVVVEWEMKEGGTFYVHDITYYSRGQAIRSGKSEQGGER